MEDAEKLSKRLERMNFLDLVRNYGEAKEQAGITHEKSRELRSSFAGVEDQKRQLASSCLSEIERRLKLLM